MSVAGSAVGPGEEYLVVDGRELRLTNPDRVLFAATGTTKSDVIAFYMAVAPVMLPHLLGRPATRKRWPDGVDGGPSFFVKEVEAGVPVWLPRVQVAQRWGGKFYPVLDSAAALAWLGLVVSGLSGPAGAGNRRFEWPHLRLSGQVLSGLGGPT